MLDSNILIGYLNGDGHIISALQSWRSAGRVFFISHASVIEVLSLASLTSAQIARIENFLSDFIVISLDMDISRRAAALRRAHKLSLADSIIVASAESNNLPLITRDKTLQKLFSTIAV